MTRIKEAMVKNGYQTKFIEKVIQKQIKRSSGKGKEKQEQQTKTVTTSIPFLDGLSQEIRRIASTAGIRCTFRTLSTLKGLYNVKDSLDSKCQTHAVYSVKYKTC